MGRKEGEKGYWTSLLGKHRNGRVAKKRSGQSVANQFTPTISKELSQAAGIQALTLIKNRQRRRRAKKKQMLV
jgi:hypothetical protein